MPLDARARLFEMHAIERLSACDASLFPDPAVAADRLGWIGSGARALHDAPELASIGALVSPGITDVVVLGMGGSSLAALVLSRTFGSAPGAPVVHVLDTTSPRQTTSLIDTLSPASTLVIVASKSGTTAEPLAQLELFRPWLVEALGDAAGSHLVATTDPGSPLEALALEAGFARVVHTPSDVGGRYASLTPFALLPAALAGIDIERLASTADAFEDACRVPSDDNPALALAGWMGDAYAAGRDKLTVICSSAMAAFGLWVEQLVAESTGKNGAGILPVLEDAPGLPAAHSTDRMTFVLRLEGDVDIAGMEERLPAGEPVFEVVVDDPYALAAEFVHWMWAVALFSALEGIEPFDQPDVESAKSATRALLASPVDATRVGPLSSLEIPTGDLASSVRALTRSAAENGYVAVLAYLPEDEELLGPLRAQCARLSALHRIPFTLQLGPRYLHSTGQYFKGGPRNGSYLIVSAGHCDSAQGPLLGLARLNAAQAAGDASALLAQARPRPVLSVVLDGETAGDLAPLIDALQKAGLD
jgi:glucose-6-phosphate isomerase